MKLTKEVICFANNSKLSDSDICEDQLYLASIMVWVAKYEQRIAFTFETGLI